MSELRPAVYLVGAPATGKTTVMALLLDRLGLVTGEQYQPWPVKNTEFRVEPLEDLVTGEHRGLSLGVTRPGGFPGTDGLGMAASPDAVGWVLGWEEAPTRLVGEGARLGTVRFLQPLSQRMDLAVAHLTAREDVLDARCLARGSDQSPRFRRTVTSQARNVANELIAQRSATVYEWDTDDVDVEDIVDILALHLA